MKSQFLSVFPISQEDILFIVYITSHIVSTLNFNDNATTIIIEKYNSKSNSKTLFMNIMNNV